MKKQIQGLKWFISPEHDEIATAWQEVAVTKEAVVADAQVVKDAVAVLLREVYPKSIHYLEILQILEGNGIVVPGKDS